MPDVAVCTQRVLSLFSGIGGLDLGLRLVARRARVVCYVEGEAYCAAILAARMEDGLLDKAPVWSDVRTFDVDTWRGLVDGVLAGFPCQPASLAGKRRGHRDERWLWPDIRRILGAVRPGWVFLENVPGLLTVNGGAAFQEVLGSLAALGFDAEWGCYRATDVGAPHRRERLFMLAHAPGVRRRERRPESGRLEGRPHVVVADGNMGHTERQRLAIRPGFRGEHGSQCPAAERAGGHGLVADPERGGRDRLYERIEPGYLASDARRGAPGLSADTARAEACRPFPPGPDDLRAWACVPPELEPAVCRVADGLPDRVDRLRALGNAVVPECAALAFRDLYLRLGLSFLDE